jgi:hypothetical protein
MYKIIVNICFKEWLLVEDEKSQLAEFSVLKNDYINPFIDRLIQHGDTHPGFLTPSQKTELMHLKTSDDLFHMMSSADRGYFDKAGALTDSDKIKKLINREIGKLNFDAAGNLGDLIHQVNTAKTSKSLPEYDPESDATPYRRHTVDDIKQFLDHIFSRKVIYTTKRAEKDFGGTGGAKGATEDTPGIEGLAKVQAKDPEEIRELGANLEARRKIDKLSDCVRLIFTKQNEKYARKAKNYAKQVENSIADPEEKLSVSQLVDLKLASLFQIVSRYMNERVTSIDERGFPTSSDLFVQKDIDNVLQGRVKLLDRIVKSENFIPYLRKLIKDNDPVAVDLEKAVLGILFVAAAKKASSTSGSIAQVMPAFMGLEAVKSNAANQKFLQNLKEKFLDDKVLTDKFNFKKLDALNAVSEGKDGALDSYMISHTFPDINKGTEEAATFLNFMEKMKNTKEPLIGARGERLTLDLEKDCEDVAQILQKAGVI